MPKLFLTVAILLTLFSIGLPTQSQNDQRQVWAFYLSFWAGQATWDWNTDVLTDTPLIGAYNSKLPEVAALHIQQARYAGIDAFWVNWWGLDEQVTTTPALLNLLGRAAEQDFQIAVVVDLYVPQFNRDLDQLEISLRWLMQEVITHPAYLHYQGKPLIAFAFPAAAGFSSRQWRALREAVDPARETWWISEGLNGCCLYDGVMDGMYAFNMAWASGSADRYRTQLEVTTSAGGTIYIPTVSPGWDEDAVAQRDNRPNPTSRREREDGGFLVRGWGAALEINADAILIVSWNEFVENSHIEPSVLYGTQSLDILRVISAAWQGRTLDAAAAPMQFAVRYAARTETPVEVLASADRTALSIGRTSAGDTYPILGENNGLYEINLRGARGYIPFEAITILPVVD
jgi:hypothetical protein